MSFSDRRPARHRPPARLHEPTAFPVPVLVHDASLGGFLPKRGVWETTRRYQKGDVYPLRMDPHPTREKLLVTEDHEQPRLEGWGQTVLDPLPSEPSPRLGPILGEQRWSLMSSWNTSWL